MTVFKDIRHIKYPTDLNSLRQYELRLVSTIYMCIYTHIYIYNYNGKKDNYLLEGKQKIGKGIKSLIYKSVNIFVKKQSKWRRLILLKLCN